MNSITNNGPLVVADLAEGLILASVEFAAPPERVFRALASDEIMSWWVRPGVFDTREWSGEVQVGGRWRSAGMFKGNPYTLEGEFLEIDPPYELVHTYGAGAPWGPTTVIYRLEPVEAGTHVTLHHSGFTARENCAGNCVGWETSFEKLAEILSHDRRPCK
jgi:uncharacterized protein YndB with AHSA1/START domain